MRVLTLSLVLALPGPLLGAPQGDASNLEARVSGVAAELSAAGFTVDLDQVSIEVRPRSDCVGDMSPELLALFGGEAGAATWRRVRSARGAEPSAGTAEMIARTATQILEARAVYYNAQRNALVFVEDTLATIQGRDAELAHALAVAGRDQVHELSVLTTDPAPTLDQRLTQRALVHGEGQVAAVALMALRDSSSVERRSDRALDHRLRNIGLPTFESEAWIRGRVLVQRTLESDAGRAGLAALWEQPPVSTEQASHRTKLGRDEPTVPPMPDWPEKAGEATLVYEDTLGELGLHSLLLDGRVPRTKAWIASVGWEGDVIRRYETAEGKNVIVWRTVWDRPADAQQFAAEWSARSSGHVRAGGRAVDWVLATERGVWNKWLKAFEATPPRTQSVRSDVNSTEALEEDFHDSKASSSYLAANQWRFPKYDLTVEVPIGWYEDERDGFKYVVRTKTAGFRDHIYVIAKPIPDGGTVEQALEINRARLDQDDHLDLELAELREVEGVQVGYLRYRDLDANHSIVYSTTFFMHEKGQIAVTVAVAGEVWTKISPVVDEVMENLHFGEVPRADSDG